MKKIIRATTVPQSLDVFCKGMLRELAEEYEVIGLSSPGESLDRVATREGIRTVAVPMERRISLFKDIVSLIGLIKVFHRECPYLVHSMTPKAGLLCMVAARLTKVPRRVHTFTGLVFPTSKGIKKRILMLCDKVICACATHVLPEGEGVKNDLMNYKITKKPLIVLGYGNVRGIDLDYYSRREEVIKLREDLCLRDEKKFTFLFVGRIVKDKGIDELCEAIDKLSSSAPIRLFLVGKREDSIDPISISARMIIANNTAIEAVGPKYGDELLAYYAASDCFVLPSYREGFPNTVIEAGALGLPCVVTDINGSREIVNNGFNGLIVSPQNKDALYEAMKWMLDNPDERVKMASVARDHIATHYEQGFVRHCLYSFYKSIM